MFNWVKDLFKKKTKKVDDREFYTENITGHDGTFIVRVYQKKKGLVKQYIGNTHKNPDKHKKLVTRIAKQLIKNLRDAG